MPYRHLMHLQSYTVKPNCFQCTSTHYGFSFTDTDTNYSTTLQLFYGSLDFVRDYTGKPVTKRYYQEGKTNLDLLEQEMMSGSGTSWAKCKSAPQLRQITMPASHQLVFTGWMPFLPLNC